MISADPARGLPRCPRITLLAFCVTLATAACDGSGGSSGAGSPGGSDTASSIGDAHGDGAASDSSGGQQGAAWKTLTSVPPDQVSATFARAVCTYWTACHPELVLHADLASCIKHRAPSTNFITYVQQTDLLLGHLTYDDKAAAACMNAIATSHCGRGQEPWRRVYGPCRQLLAGKIKPGDKCHGQLGKCADGLCAGSGCERVCVKWRQKGESCDPKTFCPGSPNCGGAWRDICGPGLLCHEDTLRCEPVAAGVGKACAPNTCGEGEFCGGAAKTCQPLGKPGGACVASELSCAAGLRCALDVASKSFKCVKKLAAGAACDADAQRKSKNLGNRPCAKGLVCTPAIGLEAGVVPRGQLKTGKCRPIAQPGLACRGSFACAGDGVHCDGATGSENGTCTAHGAEGDPCRPGWSPCGVGLVCEPNKGAKSFFDGVCRKPRGLGDACGSQAKCPATLYCSTAKLCELGPTIGQKCVEDLKGDLRCNDYAHCTGPNLVCAHSCSK